MATDFALDPTKAAARPSRHGTIPDWIGAHREAWAAKPGLVAYYQREIFARLDAAIAPAVSLPGPVLEIGTGPGFLAQHRRSSGGDLISIDISAHDGVGICADAHTLPFADSSLSSVIGVDVLHHLARPGAALAEIDRCLGAGGRFALVEPWTGPLGFLFYRFVHHEDCVAVPDPFGAAFPPGKTPMDGNAWIPRAVLRDRPAERNRFTPRLRLIACRRFGGLSYLLTGGFQGWGAPARVTGLLARVEALLPDSARAAICVRSLYVFEKIASTGGDGA